MALVYRAFFLPVLMPTHHFAYRRKSFAPAAENSPLEEGSQVKPDEEAWLDDMETESA